MTELRPKEYLEEFSQTKLVSGFLIACIGAEVSRSNEREMKQVWRILLNYFFSSYWGLGLLYPFPHNLGWYTLINITFLYQTSQ